MYQLHACSFLFCCIAKPVSDPLLEWCSLTMFRIDLWIEYSVSLMCFCAQSSFGCMCWEGNAYSCNSSGSSLWAFRLQIWALLGIYLGLCFLDFIFKIKCFI